MPGESKTVLRRRRYFTPARGCALAWHDRWASSLPHQSSHQFPGEVVNVGAASPTNMHDTKTYNVYRDDARPHGHAVCASLAQLRGPPCPTRAEGVASRATASSGRRQYAPHKRRRRADDRQAEGREIVPGGALTRITFLSCAARARLSASASTAPARAAFLAPR